MPKKVRFAQTARAVLVRGLDDYTDEEFENIWFTQEEYAEFKRRESKLSQQAPNGGSSSTSSKNGGAVGDVELGVRTMLEIGKRRARSKALHMCVASSQYCFEQAQQQNNELCFRTAEDETNIRQKQADDLANLCSLSSLVTSKEAFERGQQLAAIVRKETLPSSSSQGFGTTGAKLSTTAKKIRHVMRKRSSSILSPKSWYAATKVAV